MVTKVTVTVTESSPYLFYQEATMTFSSSASLLGEVKEEGGWETTRH